MLKDGDCDIESAVDLLDRLTLLDASTDVGGPGYDAGALVFYSTPDKTYDELTTEKEVDAWGPTAGILRDWISKFSAAHDRTFAQGVETAVRTGRGILAAQKLRAENVGKSRTFRAKLTVLPPPVDDNFLLAALGEGLLKLRRTRDTVLVGAMHIGIRA
jgi:hypothetical protein